MKGDGTHGATTLCKENLGPPINALAEASVNKQSVPECTSGVSNLSPAGGIEGADHVVVRQDGVSSYPLLLGGSSSPQDSVACSEHTAHGAECITLEGTATSPSHPQQEKVTHHTLDADQYALYATYYQWYYSVMRSAKQRAADAKAQTTEECAVESALPDSKRELVQKWLERPARQQVDEKELRRYSHTEGGTEYNIWYGKYLTDRYTNTGHQDRETAPYKCSPERDAGYTLADTTTPSTDNYFCIYFAKGACALGKGCRYRHSVPTLDDEAHLEWGHDIFGRERFKFHRDDMDGVGSFNNDCKTLFVCGFRVEPAEPDALRHTEELLRKEFEVWGDIEDVRVIPKKHIAFISYAYRVQAEFAKAAMADQNLGPRAPLLVVKWAFDNPRAERKRKCSEGSQQLCTLKQSTSADVESRLPAWPPGEDDNNVDAEAADLQKLVKCRRSGSHETVERLSELLQKQCSKWEHQLKIIRTVHDHNMKSSVGTDSGGQTVAEWTTAQTCSGSSDEAQGRVIHNSTEGEVYSVAALAPTGAGEIHSSIPGTTEEVSSEETYERQAAVANACKRIQEVLSTVENLEPAAFEVQV